MKWILLSNLVNYFSFMYYILHRLTYTYIFSFYHENFYVYLSNTTHKLCKVFEKTVHKSATEKRNSNKKSNLAIHFFLTKYLLGLFKEVIKIFFTFYIIITCSVSCYICLKLLHVTYKCCTWYIVGTWRNYIIIINLIKFISVQYIHKKISFSWQITCRFVQRSNQIFLISYRYYLWHQLLYLKI